MLPGYFEVLHTPLTPDAPSAMPNNAPDRKGVVIDQLLAGKAFPGESAVGKRLRIRVRTPEPEWVEVIGVAAHQRDTSLAVAGREQIYFTDGFLGHGAAGNWAMHTAGDPAKYARRCARRSPSSIRTCWWRRCSPWTRWWSTRRPPRGFRCC